MWRSKFIVIIVTLLIFTYVGFGFCFDWDSARKVKLGMTTEEVVGLLGKPYNIISAGNVVKYIWVDVSFWTGANKSILIPFIDGKVADVPKIPDNF